MNNPTRSNPTRHDQQSPGETEVPKLFATPPDERPRRGFLLIAAAAAVIVLALLAGVVFLHGRHATVPSQVNAVLPVDAYAQNLSFTQLAMSQSTSLSGGTSTFVDGHVRNSGTETLTAVTMQVIFRNDVGLSPQVETLPLTLIRMHEPYIDTEPVSAAPLKPGDDVEFRLIFESVPDNWNQQMPELRVIHVSRK